MNGLRGAVGFLTRIPVGHGEAAPSASTPWFPVVGLGVGAFAGLAFWGASFVTEPGLAAVVGVGTAVAVTGAFHEDGLADTFDGLSSIRTRERQLEIMRDSRLGTFGVAALVLVLGARITAIASLTPGLATVITLAWVHALSRGLVIGIMPWTRPAAAEGSGLIHLTGVRRAQVSTVALVTAAAGWWVVGSDLAMALVCAGVGPLAIWLWAERRIGGVTGDVLGACQQLSLVGALAVVAA